MINPKSTSHNKRKIKMARVSRTKARISLLVDRIAEVAEKYPQLSVNALATAADWTQSSFQRAAESREVTLTPRTGSLNVAELLAQFAEVRNYEACDELLDSIQYLKDGQTVEIEEPEVEAPAEAEDADEDDLEATEASEDMEDDEEDPNEIFE
jgi:hypothetical protein